jgi:hypothetical protein
MGRHTLSYPHLTFFKNLKQVHRLLEIHAKIAGAGPGYKHDVEVLNKSAIVLLIACWESFVEDLAETAFTILLRRAKNHQVFSKKVLAESAKALKESHNPCHIWDLAGEGWRSVLKKHKLEVFKKYTGKLNTPRPAQVGALYESLLGMKSLPANWHWQGMSARSSAKKLNELVELRGTIAHRVEASRKIRMGDVRGYIDFVNRISVETSNGVRALILAKTGKSPWTSYKYRTRAIR